MDFALEARSISRLYKNKVALHDFSLRIRQGSVFGLLGPNGAGKSTFIRIIAGLEEPDSGELVILGERPGKESRRRIGVAPQENAIYSLLTCMENLLYFGSLYGVKGKVARERAENLLAKLGLTEKKDVQAGYLSGGMKRRLSLACALLHEPKIIILDEPTTGLDPATRVRMWDTVKQVVKSSRATLLLTTHYMEEAEALCTRIAFVNSGQIVAEGTPDELKRLVGKEFAEISTVPGEPGKLVRIIRGIKGVKNATATERGIVVEGDDVSSKLPEISKALRQNGETVVEMSLSKPSLEDVFLKMTGAKLREVGKGGPAK